MSQEVIQYIESLTKKPNQQWQVKVCESLRKMIHKTIPDVEERLQYGKPHYLKNGHYACVIHTAKDKVSFMIFNATGLQEIKGFFQSMSGPERKTATIKEGQKVDYDLLADLLKRAVKSL
jgi:hypothetical protein